MSNNQFVTVDLESLEDQVDSIFHELDLAIKWKRPSIVFAVYNSRSVRLSAQDFLENLIYRSGQAVIHYQVEYDHDLSIAKFIDKSNDKLNSVFYIDPLSSEGKISEIDRLISMLEHFRGYVVDNLVRVVFWLTQNELLKVAHQAPDFWASRHRVFEFIDNNNLDNNVINFEDTPVEHFELQENTIDAQGLVIDSGISSESKLKFDVQDDSDFSTNGINLLLMFGVTQWQQGSFEKACEPVLAALAIAEKTSNMVNQIMCLKAISLIYSEAGHVDKAIESYKRMLLVDPRNYEGWKNLGEVYLKTSFFMEALDAYKSAVSLNADDPASWNGLGNVKNKLGEVEEAIMCYRKSITLDANYLAPWENLADLLLSQNRITDALYAFMRIVEMDNKNIHAWAEIGSIYLKAGSYEQAIDAYRKAIALGVDSQVLQANLANAYISIGKYQDAIPLYQSLIAKETNLNEKATWLNVLGDVYQKINSIADAAESYALAERILKSPFDTSEIGVAEINLALEGAQENIDGYIYQGEVAQNNYENPVKMDILSAESNSYIDSVPVVEHFDKFSQNTAAQVGVDASVQETIQNEKSLVWVRLASTYIKAGALDKAINAYCKVIDIDPLNVQAYMWLAEAYISKNNFPEAIRIYKKSLEFERQNADKVIIYNKIADLYRMMKDYLNALETYETALLYDPQNEFILDGLNVIQDELDGKVENHIEKENTVVTDDEVAIQTNDENRENSNTPQVDVELFEVSSSGMDLKNSSLWNELGVILTKSNSYEDAEQAFRKAIENNAENGWAIYNLGIVLTRQARYEEAVVLFQKSIGCLKAGSDKAIAWNSLGDLHRQAGRYSDAIEAYQNADRIHQASRFVPSARESNNETASNHFVV